MDQASIEPGEIKPEYGGKAMGKFNRLFLVFCIVIFCSFIVGCAGRSGVMKSNAEKIYKTNKDKDFKSTSKVEKKQDDPLIIEACFTFDEQEEGNVPIYIIPPDDTVVELRLVTTENEWEAPCRLRAYKLNPKDDPDPRARGDLVKLDKTKPYCITFKLSDFFSADKLSKNEFDVEARYSWSVKDPELKEKAGNPDVYVCPDDDTECYTIWQGVAVKKIKIKKTH